MTTDKHTTIVIAANLHQQLKIAAAKKGCTIKQLAEEAISAFLATQHA